MKPDDRPLHPRRVVHVIGDYLPYSQTWVHRQMRWLPDADIAVIAERFVAPGLSAFPVDDVLALQTAFPFTYRPAAMLSPGRRLAPRLAERHIRARAPRLLHAHFGDTGWRWLPVSTRLGLPLVTSFYGRDMSALPRQDPCWRRRYRRLFAAGTRFLCEGPSMAAALEALGCPRERIGIQRLGIDARDIETRLRVRQPRQPLAVLAAARFTQKKGLPDAIAAVGLAAREVDLQLTLVGDASRSRSGQQEARRIADAAAASGLGERLRLVGVLPHDQLLALAYRSHVFLQPSRTAADGDSEGGAPVTLLEMAATGLPAVATRHADIPDVILDGITGWLADEGDVKTLAAHLVRAAREPEEVRQMGERAALRARAEFGADVCAATLRRHYAEVASAA